MRFRSILGLTLAVAVAAAVGIGGGYGLGRHDRPAVATPPTPVTVSSIAPLQAQPELPVAATLKYAPDYRYPPLATGLTYVSARVSGQRHTWEYHRPAGWKKYPAGPSDPAGTVRWRPADEAPDKDGFVMRVLPIVARDTPQDLVTLQTTKMRRSYRDVKVPYISSDTVWFTFRSEDNYRRYNYFAWVTAPGTPYAGFEISVAGRVVDQDGLAHLLDEIKKSARQVK